MREEEQARVLLMECDAQKPAVSGAVRKNATAVSLDVNPGASRVRARIG